MIFRGTQADNCFDIPDIDASNTTWLPIYTTISSPSVTVGSISDISIDLPFSNSDNYPLIYEVFNHYVTNTKYALDADKMDWGEIELDGFYKRYPLQNYKCGMIARNKRFLDGSSIREFKYTSATDVSITIITTRYGC